MNKTPLPIAFIDNWFVVGSNTRIDKRAGRNVKLLGTVFNHPNYQIPPGTFIHTPAIIRFNIAEKKAQTTNVIFKLGTPHPLFIKQLEDRGKFLENLPKDEIIFTKEKMNEISN